MYFEITYVQLRLVLSIVQQKDANFLRQRRVAIDDNSSRKSPLHCLLHVHSL